MAKPEPSEPRRKAGRPPGIAKQRIAAKAKFERDLLDQFASREWRLNNLYWIVDSAGHVVRFRLNSAQKQLLDELHYLNIVLKARQLGFSTLILIMALDCCLFNDHFAAGLVADTTDNAKNLLRRCKFAYDRLPEPLRQRIGLVTDNAFEMTFSNGSMVATGVSLRSGTFNFLHISEYGKICAKFPEKASEIKSGALNTLAPKQLAFIESTAEGRGGDFYDKVQAAQRVRDTGNEPGDMDYKLHFFPWFADARYTLDDASAALTPELVTYFEEMQAATGKTLTHGQKVWYAAKQREQGDAMWREFPSTEDESFKAARDGAYFAKELQSLRQRGKVGKLAFEPRTPVNTFWDLGIDDSMAIWLHQLVGGAHRFVGYYEHSGEGMAHYLAWLDKWAARRGARFGEHFGPHDMEHRQNDDRGQLTTVKSVAASLGYRFRIVTRTIDKLNSIQMVRTKLPECEFDANECDEGLKHLESYSRDWNDKYGVWESRPRHDEHSHGADAFMTFADGYIPAKKQDYTYQSRSFA